MSPELVAFVASAMLLAVALVLAMGNGRGPRGGRPAGGSAA